MNSATDAVKLESAIERVRGAEEAGAAPPLDGDLLDALDLASRRATPGPRKMLVGCPRAGDAPVIEVVEGIDGDELEFVRDDDRRFFELATPAVVSALVERVREADARLVAAMEGDISEAFRAVLERALAAERALAEVRVSQAVAEILEQERRRRSRQQDRADRAERKAADAARATQDVLEIVARGGFGGAR